MDAVYQHIGGSSVSEQFNINSEDMALIFPEHNAGLNFAAKLENLVNLYHPSRRHEVFEATVKRMIRAYEDGDSIYDIAWQLDDAFAFMYIPYR